MCRLPTLEAIHSYFYLIPDLIEAAFLFPQEGPPCPLLYPDPQQEEEFVQRVCEGFSIPKGQCRCEDLEASCCPCC